MPRTSHLLATLSILAIEWLAPGTLLPTAFGDDLQAYIVFQLNLRGELEPAKVATQSTRLESPEVQFLRSDVVQHELEVLEHQRPQLQAILDRHDKAAGRLREELLNGTLTGVKGDLPQRIEALQRETLAEFEGLLLPFQLERLNQIRFRCQVRTHGLRSLLCVGELSSRMKLDDTTRARIVDRARTQARELLTKAQDRRRAVLDELLSVLTEDQRRCLQQELGDYYYGTHSNLEVLIWQLGFTTDRAATSSEYAGFRANVWFRVAADGTLQPAPRTVRRQKPLAEVVLPQLFLNEALVNGLELSDEQMFLMEVLQDQCKKSLNRFDRDLQSAAEAGLIASRQDNAELLRMLAKQRDESLAQLDADFHRVFRPEQLARLRTLDQQLDVMRRGHLAALTNGAMGQALRVTTAQQTALHAQAESLRLALIRDTAQWQADADAALLAELPPEARHQLAGQLGPPLTKTPGNITLLLLDLGK